MTKEEQAAWWDKVLKMDETLTDREIIEDLAVCDFVDPTQPTRKIILDLIEFNSAVALDPIASKQAADLYHEGYLAGKTGAINRYSTTGEVDEY